MLRVNITVLCQIYRRWLEVMVFFSTDQLAYLSMDKILGRTTFKQWESTSFKFLNFIFYCHGNAQRPLRHSHCSAKAISPSELYILVALPSLLVDFARSSTQNKLTTSLAPEVAQKVCILSFIKHKRHPCMTSMPL